MELRLEGDAINRQGWLRAIFWTHEARKTIYVVDLFWKKTNKVSVADLHRIQSPNSPIKGPAGRWRPSLGNSGE